MNELLSKFDEIIKCRRGTKFLIRYEHPFYNETFWEFTLKDIEGKNFKTDKNIWHNVDTLKDEYKYKTIKEFIIRKTKREKTNEK